MQERGPDGDEILDDVSQPPQRPRSSADAQAVGHFQSSCVRSSTRDGNHLDHRLTIVTTNG
eukprot:3757682-Pyramimonas_sp.AAC.1